MHNNHREVTTSPTYKAPQRHERVILRTITRTDVRDEHRRRNHQMLGRRRRERSDQVID